jgi:hypothetical protein
MGLACKVPKADSKKKHSIQEGERCSKGENGCRESGRRFVEAAIAKGTNIPLTEGASGGRVAGRRKRPENSKVRTPTI